MATATLSHRSPEPTQPPPRSSVERALGHPVAYALTALLLLTLFGWTFFRHPDRVAPTKDPAYYTWRTEALISEKPPTLLSITGPFDVFSGGYRVSSAILGGYLRRIAGVPTLKVTVFFVVGLPVLISLLLGGFAFRQRGDPLAFHVVALAAGSLLLTPPFVGYLDNVLCLFFLAAALWFITPARTSWPARLALGLFLLASGFTHPTTLAIFCVVLFVMAALTLLLTRDAHEALRRDGPVVAVALVAAVLTVIAWKVGIWGRSASLSDAALSPPYGSSFFLARMGDWLRDMHLPLNIPLFGLGAIGLLAGGRRVLQDDLARVALVWLLPLVGLFGSAFGLTYPYYRFFNTTLAWVLLVGLGAYFAMRFFLAKAREAGVMRLSVLGVLAILVVIGANFARGLTNSGWNDPNAGWLSATEKQDLDALRVYLGSLAQSDRPVIFVMDNKPPTPFQIYGFMKLTGNTARYGVPPGQIDRTYLYLGSLDAFMSSRPTLTGQPTYDRLSRQFLADTQKGVRASGAKPLVILDRAFNLSGRNAGIKLRSGRAPSNMDLVKVADGRVTAVGGVPEGFSPPQTGGAPIWHLPLIVLGLAVLLLPGLLALPWFVPEASFPEILGMVPALSMAGLVMIGVVALALTRLPFSASLAWVCTGVALAIGGYLRVRSGASMPRGRLTYGSNFS